MWWDGTAGTTRLRWPEGSLASWPGDGFNSQLDGDESAKGFWVPSDTSVGLAAGPGSGGHPHSMSEAPSAQEAKFLSDRLGLAS
jgi:hypothetical protein